METYVIPKGASITTSNGLKLTYAEHLGTVTARIVIEDHNIGGKVVFDSMFISGTGSDAWSEALHYKNTRITLGELTPVGATVMVIVDP